MNVNKDIFQSDFKKHFEKGFNIEKGKEWTLPKVAFKSEKFTIQEFQDIKSSLNDVKSELNVFNLEEWSRHTQNRDIAGYVMSHLRKSVKPELLTQAWCKFYEIISTFPVIPEVNFLHSLHLCEAPGAFICALNHYLVLNTPNIKWDWMANTLNPYYEGNSLTQMISDNRLICHTYKNWLFGIDLTGDIKKFYNHCDIVDKATSKGKIHLVTADGSIDCMHNPGEQERLVEFLNYCEMITAVKCLQKGGSFILKIFTIFEDTTICLLYFLNCIFEKVSLFKPCTSKSGNSELYVICIGFIDINISDSLWVSLTQPYKQGSFNKRISMFCLKDLPTSFISQLLTCCQYFFIELQVNVIKNNIQSFFQTSEDYNLHRMKTVVATYYQKKCKLKCIPKSKKIVSHLNVHERKRKLSQFDYISEFNDNKISLKENNLKELLTIIYGYKLDSVCNSHFASMYDINNLMKYKMGKGKSSSLYSLTLKYFEKTVLVINSRDFDITSCYKFQKSLITTLSLHVKTGKHILFLNVPFHTHFLAGLWSILANGFECVYFGPGWSLFFNPMTELSEVIDVFKIIQNAYDKIDNILFPSDILHLFPSDIFDNQLRLVVPVLSICNKFQLPIK